MNDKELYPFSLLLPSPIEGNFYDRYNESVNALKNLLNNASGRTLKPNQLGQLASGFVHGQVYRVNGKSNHNLYSLAEGGWGITFNDPQSLYKNWSEKEMKVGPTMQTAMRNIIDYALDTRLPAHIS